MALETLVILESGGRWPEWLDEDDPTLLCLCQEGRESTSEFHGRAERFLRELSTPAASAVVVSGEGGDEMATETRRCLLVALVDHLELDGGGKLVLIADGDYVTRRSLTALALELSEFLEETDSPVSCRLRAQPRSSPPPAPDARTEAA
jgi:hypothetical protein